MNNTLKGLFELGIEDVEKAAKTLLHAFYTDPFSVYLVPDESKRDEYLYSLFEFLTRYGLNYGTVFSTTENVNDISIWYRVKKVKNYLIRAVRSGYLRFTRNVSRDMVLRFRYCIGELGKIHASTVNTPYWYLNFIGVDPPFRGRGIGSTHLEKMLIKIDREKLPCYLESFTEENIKWYEKYNFKVIDSFEICNSRVWALLRE